MDGVKHDFLENGREIFFAEGLDRANQVDLAHENCGFGATIFTRTVAGRLIERSNYRAIFLVAALGTQALR